MKVAVLGSSGDIGGKVIEELFSAVGQVIETARGVITRVPDEEGEL